MDTESLMWQDAVAQAELVQARAVSPAELCESAAARIERLDPSLNCVVTPVEPRCSEGPLAGLPMLVQDLHAPVGGAPYTGGSAFLRDYVAPRDGDVVARFRRAGLVPVGLTNTSELGLLPTTEPALYGATRNPWDPEHSPGGSCGGSAAAVAAGMVALAYGDDAAGALRIAASSCGVFGFKPTRGEHVLTRSVRDSAAVLAAVRGPLPTAPRRRLRIMFTEGEAQPDCRRAVRETARLCAELGHHVIEAAPDVAPLQAGFRASRTAFAAATIYRWAELVGRAPHAWAFEPLTWAVYAAGRRERPSSPEIAACRLPGVFARHDVWLTPTLAAPPPPLGSFDAAAGDPFELLSRAARHAQFTWPANVTGAPAMSVPLHRTAGGLPIGTHFLARPGEDAVLLALAAELETARPWQHHRPAERAPSLS